MARFWVRGFFCLDDIRKLEGEMELCGIAKKGNRTKEEYEREQSEDFKMMQRFRAGVEGTISFLKRAFGLIRCINKGFKHFANTVGSIIFCHNLVVLSRS